MRPAARWTCKVREMRKIPELLAPGGSPDGIRAAVNAGADAVYAGGKVFGARAFAENMDQDGLFELMDYCHIRGRKLYLTVNTLVKESELEHELYDYIAPLYEHGLDAVLVQDFGVFRFLREHFPGLPLHASTQMTVTGTDGLDLLTRMGAERVVLSRELSLAEIRKIHKANPVELETFVHGALCYCYSGQCLMSSLIGGRSGNRGRCAQPCRLPYLWREGLEQSGSGFPAPEFSLKTAPSASGSGRRDGGRTQSASSCLLSLKDICTLELIPDLAEAGISSLKIEGRMKRAEYAAGTVSIYRKMLDYYRDHGRDGCHVDEEDLRALADLYNRGGFSEGYYGERNGRSMMFPDRPNHYGTDAARVLGGGKQAGRKNSILAEALEDLYTGDSLEIGGKEYSLTQAVEKGGTFSLPLRGASVPAGTVLRRVHAGHLLDSLKEKYVDTQMQVPVLASLRMHAGEQAELTVSLLPQQSSEVISAAVRSEEIVQEALQRPLTGEAVARQICRSGGTAFEIGSGTDSLEIDMDPSVFFSLRSLNELRRSALDALREKMLAPYHRTLPDAGESFSEASEISETLEGASSSEKSMFSDTSAAPDNFSGFDLSEDSEQSRALSVSVSVMTAEQLRAVLKNSAVERVCLDLSVLDSAASPGDPICGTLAEKIRRLLRFRDEVRTAGKKCFLSFPPIWRLDTVSAFESVVPPDVLLSFDGALLQSYDQLEYIIRLRAGIEEQAVRETADHGGSTDSVHVSAGMCTAASGSFTVIADAGLYTWNSLSRLELHDLGVDLDTIPAELTFREIRDRSFVPGLPASELIVYGRQRLMVTAQCLTKNNGRCRYPVKNGDIPPHGWGILTDRKGAQFPVRRSCLFCMNEIFNSVPLELLSLENRVKTVGAGSVRIAFTTESAEKAAQILDLTERVFVSGENLPEDAWKKAVPERTGGHFTNKVE